MNVLWMMHCFASNAQLGQNFFISWFTNPPTVIFWKVEKKLIPNFFFYYFIGLLEILFVSLKKILYFWGSVCVFLRVTLLKVIALSILFKD